MPSTRERGFNKLPKPDLNGQDLFFDIEGLDKVLNPEETSNDKSGLEYLFGIYNHANKKGVIPTFLYDMLFFTILNLRV